MASSFPRSPARTSVVLTGVTLALGSGCSTGLDGVTYDLDGGAPSSSVTGGSTSITSTGVAGSGAGATTGPGGATSASSSTGTGMGGSPCWDGMGAGGSPSCADGDEFDGPWRNCWTELDPTGPTFDVVGGELTIQPPANTGSYDDQLAPFLYRSIDGGFLIATYVIAGKDTDPALPPDRNYNMAGLFVRAPTAPSMGMEAWIKYEIGYRDTGLLGTTSPVGTLAAVTSGSVSHHVLPYGDEGTHIGGLAICHFGSAFLLYRRLCGAWEEQPQFDLTEGTGNVPDLPTTLQVGMIAGAYEGPPADLGARFGWVRFAASAPTSAPQCLAALQQLAPDPR